jgi:hypothetical protein
VFPAAFDFRSRNDPGAFRTGYDKRRHSRPFLFIFPEGFDKAAAARDKGMGNREFKIIFRKEIRYFEGPALGGKSHIYAQIAGAGHAPGNRLTMGEFSQSGGRFKRVAEGMPEVKKGPFRSPLFGIGLDYTALYRRRSGLPVVLRNAPL